MEATGPFTRINMRRGIAALGAFAAVAWLLAVATPPRPRPTTTAATLTSGADSTRFTQVQTFAETSRKTQALPLTSFKKSEADMVPSSPPRCPPATAPT